MPHHHTTTLQMLSPLALLHTIIRIYLLVVKSVSRLEEPLLSARPQLHASSVRFPQAQAEESAGSLFSVTAFSQAGGLLVCMYKL
jgi:hypothetical protein